MILKNIHPKYHVLLGGLDSNLGVVIPQRQSFQAGIICTWLFCR
jgi:hypothetical protein